MAMRCPDCGSTNSEGSKFCNSCGRKLAPPTRGRCPECGALNIPSNIFCDECGTRLFFARPATEAKNDESAVRGLSLPSKEPSPDDDSLDWLAQMRSSFGEQESEESEEPDQGKPESLFSERDTSLVESTPPPLQDDTPDWLSAPGLAETGTTRSERDHLSATEPDEIPDWLQDALKGAAVPSEQDSTRETNLEAGELPDWLQGQVPDQKAPEIAPALPIGKGVEPDELPDWLQDTVPAEGKPGLIPSPTGGEEIEPGELLDWLQDATLGEKAPDLVTSPTGEEEIVPDELPDWLQEMQAPDPVAPDLAPPTDQDAIEPGELPDWLQEVQAPDPVAPDLASPASEGTVESGELPSWLQDFALEETESDIHRLAPPVPLDQEALKSESPAEQRPRETPTPAETRALTDWLGETALSADDSKKTPAKALGGTGPLAPPELPEWLAAVSGSSATELPDWLDQEDDADTLLAADSPPLEKPATGPLPSWLTPKDAGLKAPEDALFEFPAEPEAELAPADLPDWLQLTSEVISKSKEEQLASPDGGPGIGTLAPDISMDADAVEQLGLMQANIPDWLQALKPQEVQTSPPQTDESEKLEPMEKGGFLDGVRGALMVQSEVAILPTSQAVPRFVITEQQQAHARVLEQIAHAGPAPKPDIVQERRTRALLERLIIPLLVLAAVLFPVYGDNPLDAFLGKQAESQQVIDTFNLLELELLSDSVLVIAAFDYSPAEAGELDPVSTAMLNQLMNRRVRILAVSTTLTGPQVAQNVMGELADDHNYIYGEDYINLGYIPGGAAGLQAFANNPWHWFPGADYLDREPTAQDAPIAAGLANSLSNANAILVFTAERNDLVGWVEQVGRLEEMQGVKMVAGVSASLEPWAQPYYQSSPRQLDGLVSGIPGAAQYECSVNQHGAAQQTDNAINLQDGQVFSLGVIIILITIGLLWGIGYGLVNRRRGDG